MGSDIIRIGNFIPRIGVLACVRLFEIVILVHILFFERRVYDEMQFYFFLYLRTYSYNCVLIPDDKQGQTD